MHPHLYLNGLQYTQKGLGVNIALGHEMPLRERRLARSRQTTEHHHLCKTGQNRAQYCKHIGAKKQHIREKTMSLSL